MLDLHFAHRMRVAAVAVTRLHSELSLTGLAVDKTDILLSSHALEKAIPVVAPIAKLAQPVSHVLAQSVSHLILVSEAFDALILWEAGREIHGGRKVKCDLSRETKDLFREYKHACAQEQKLHVHLMESIARDMDEAKRKRDIAAKSASQAR